MTDAPGGPGIPPRWTSSDKSGVGTALSPTSRVWFTLSHGILNEIYYPRVDQACTRDFGMMVTDGAGFSAEEKRETGFEITMLEDGVPAYELINTHKGGRFRIRKRVISDPRRDVVLQQIRFEALKGEKLRLFGLLAPHLVNGGAHNTAWLGEYKGQEMLFAEGDGTALALAASRPFLDRSVGFVGVNDGWQLLSRHGHLQGGDSYDRAADGNVALTAELDVTDGASLVLAVAFGRTAAEAAFRARASLQEDFDLLAEEYAAIWRRWQASLRSLDRRSGLHNTYRISTAVMRTHESPTFPGGLIASLSVPWGASKGDDDLGGYHLVWPRDLAQTAGGLLACGAHAEARRVMGYLRATQEADGSWPQNSWLDGTPYWRGLQMDECAFPILLVDLAWRQGAMRRPDLQAYWPMILGAAGFVARTGPITGQDRWEEDGGYTPFTIGVQIAALLAAADLALICGSVDLAAFLRDTADAWNDRIEDWIYVSDTPLAREVGVAGYYVRIMPSIAGTSSVAGDATVVIKNRPADASHFPAHAIISQDALGLVRFGLRRPDDPRILDTVKVIDHLTRMELPAGPCWHRYNEDGYGERSDGRPFNGAGIGRLWPLLTGERALYELAAGNRAEAERLLVTMESCASHGGLLPEQVWDTTDIPERELFFGHPSGSAMPLVWAHSEHVKLLRSLADGEVFDLPPQASSRYLGSKPGDAQKPARCWSWRPDWQSDKMRPGRVLRIELPEPGRLHWSVDHWKTRQDTTTRDTTLGLHVVEVPTDHLPVGTRIIFTWRTDRSGAWLGHDNQVEIVSEDSHV